MSKDKLTVKSCMTIIKRLVEDSGFTMEEATEDVIGDLIRAIEDHIKSRAFIVRKLEKIKEITEQP